MAAMSDAKLACEALKASGMRGCATWSLLFPIGRKARTCALLRKRRAVLEAKNAVLDSLFRFQKALEPLGLRTRDQAEAMVRDPERRRTLVAVGLNRSSLEDELSRYGVELGSALDRALVELVQEQRVLRVATPGALPGSDLYLVVYDRGRGRYDLGLIDRLLQRGRGQVYGDVLRTRERSERDSGGGRSYDL